MTMSKFIPLMSPYKLSYILPRYTEIFIPYYPVLHCMVIMFTKFCLVLEIPKLCQDNEKLRRFLSHLLRETQNYSSAYKKISGPDRCGSVLWATACKVKGCNFDSL